MKAINAVVASGTYAEAARMLGVSQPAVSQHVRETEQEFGVRLFERSNGQLQPTPVCLELGNVTERITQHEAEALRLLNRQNTLAGGRLTIGLGNTMPGMALISLFHSRYPTIEISVQTGSHSQITRAVTTREVDVGVLPDIATSDRFRQQRLVRQGVVAIVHPDHQFATMPRITCRHLMDAPLIFRTPGSSAQRVVDRAFRSLDLVPTPFLRLDTRDGVYEAVANGLGVGFMWRHGTSRTDAVKRVPISEVDAEFDEVVFAHADERGELLTAFFQSAETFSQRWR